MDHILQIPTSEPQTILNLLNEFSTTNANETTFIPSSGLETKKKFVSHLLSLCSSTEQSPQLRASCLNCLRLLSREYQGMDALISPEGLSQIFSLIGISGEETTKATEGNQERAHPEFDIQSEAGKCLVNLTLKHKDKIEAFIQQHNYLPKFVTLLKKPSSPKALLFPLGRVLFHLTLRSDFREALVQPDIDAGLFFSKVVKECFDDDVTKSENQLYVREALKVILNLTTPVGPLGDSGPNGRPPTPQESVWFDILCPVLEQILLLPSTREYHGLKVDVISCLINVPNTHVPMFNQKLMVPALLEFLDHHIVYTEQEPSGLIPILLILNSISGASYEVRQIVRKHIFPPDFGDDSPSIVQIPPWIERGDSIAAKLVRHMTSSNFGLKHYSQELLFTLCSENADEFTRLAGFGSAAGLLATRNLLHAFAGVGRSKSSTESSSSSESSKHSGPPPTITADQSTHEQAVNMQRIASMDKEERQRYLESLPDEELKMMAEMMQKLEASGTIKVIRDTDKKN